jgi:spore maturation protein CgeB
MRDLLAQIGVGEPDRIGRLLTNDRQATKLKTAGGTSPVLARLLGEFPATQRVELKDVAARIRQRGATATLDREELLLLMLDEYRSEVRDLA